MINRSHEYSYYEWLLKIFLDGFSKYDQGTEMEKRASFRYHVALAARRS